MATSPTALAHALEEHYAVIYAPRRHRDRFPENCVELHPTASDALAHSDPTQQRHAALVRGPFRSSEGFRLFYLLRWLV